MKTASQQTRAESTGKGIANSIGSRKGSIVDTGSCSPVANNLHPLVGMIDSSPQVQQYSGLQKKIDKSPYTAVQMKQQNNMFGVQPVQHQEEEELMQGKFETAQRHDGVRLALLHCLPTILIVID